MKTRESNEKKKKGPEGQKLLSRRKWKIPEEFKSKNERDLREGTMAYIPKESSSQELRSTEMLWKQKTQEAKVNLLQEMKEKKEEERD